MTERRKERREGDGGSKKVGRREGDRGSKGI